MISSAIDDLWNLTPSFMKKKLNVKPKEERLYYIRCQVFGEMLDELRDAFLLSIRQWFPDTCTDFDILKVLSKNRGIFAYEGETFDELKIRLFGVVPFWRNTGTLSGTKKAIQALGYDDVTIDERVTTQSDYDVTVTVPQTTAVSEANALNLVTLINQMKVAYNLPRDIIFAQTIQVSIQASSISAGFKQGTQSINDTNSYNLTMNGTTNNWTISETALTKLKLSAFKRFAVGEGTPPSQTALGSSWLTGDIVDMYYEGLVSVFVFSLTQADGEPTSKAITEIGFGDVHDNIQVTLPAVSMVKLTTTKTNYIVKITLT